ncbi:MAG: 2-dehydropantoate 2-reductase [Halobacteriota archaeon]|nr:2-dehydropantoate 2-reductase [Halobacteriota archaeon]
MSMKRNPKIMVLGAGAIGSLFGGLLSNFGYEVTLVGREAHVNAINENGLIISGFTEKTVKVDATTEPVESDIVLLTVKSYDTARAIGDITISKDTIVVSIQNGLNNLETICKYVDKSRVIGGVTSNGSLSLSPGKIKHTGIGYTVIGGLNEDGNSVARDIAKLLTGAGLKTEVSGDIMGRIWEKLMINVGINAPAALTGMRNGELPKIKETKWVMVEAIREAISVADKFDITIPKDMVARVVDVTEKTAENRCSMLQDVTNKKKTEIDAINGAIVNLGEETGVDTPINRTLYSLIKGIESKK